MSDRDAIAAEMGNAVGHPEIHLIGGQELTWLDRWQIERRSRALVDPVYLGDHLALCRVLGRYKFYVDTRDVGFAAHILMDGFWEGWITRFLTQKIKPGMAAVDVGANHGYYSVLFADLVGEKGRVACVEPNPDLCRMLRNSLALNGFKNRARVYEFAAVEAEAQTLKFYVPEGEPKNGSLNPDLYAMLNPGMPVPELTCFEVQGRPLHQMLADWDRVDFVKIDVEGAEEAALKGLMPIIDRDRPELLVEFNPQRCADPAGLLLALRRRYRAIDFVDVDCEAHPIDDATLLARSDGEDWLIYCHAG